MAGDSSVVNSPSVADLPPSSKLVLRVIAAAEPTDRQTLIAETMLPERTVDEALARLREAGCIESSPDPADGRRCYYETCDNTEIQEG